MYSWRSGTSLLLREAPLKLDKKGGKDKQTGIHTSPLLHMWVCVWWFVCVEYVFGGLCVCMVVCVC